LDSQQAYQTLNLEKDSSFTDVKIAYRKLALELHPDKSTIESDGMRFKKVTEAYHILKNQRKKLNSQRNVDTSKWKYTETKTREKDNFSKRPQWGAPPGGKTPEEDWGRFTKDIEDTNPDFWKQYEKKFWQEYNENMKTNNDQREFDKTKEPKDQPNLFVDVDKSLCIGCCSCETIAPNVFQVDKHTKFNPKSSVINQKGAKINKIMDAAQTCPTKAISVVNITAKEKLWPL